MRLTLSLHWPHNRFAFGWEVYYPDEEVNTTEIVLYLGIITIGFEF